LETDEENLHDVPDVMSQLPLSSCVEIITLVIGDMDAESDEVQGIEAAITTTSVRMPTLRRVKVILPEGPLSAESNPDAMVDRWQTHFSKLAAQGLVVVSTGSE
jgi:hypothetical protein